MKALFGGGGVGAPPPPPAAPPPPPTAATPTVAAAGNAAGQAMAAAAGGGLGGTILTSGQGTEAPSTSQKQLVGIVEMTESCAICRFFYSFGGHASELWPEIEGPNGSCVVDGILYFSNQGFCRRRAPVGPAPGFPVLIETQWCGEFERMPPNRGRAVSSGGLVRGEAAMGRQDDLAVARNRLVAEITEVVNAGAPVEALALAIERLIDAKLAMPAEKRTPRS